MQNGKWNVSRLISLALVLVGNITFALSLKLFLLPSGLISCGSPGLALVVQHYFRIPVNSFLRVFNIVTLIFGWWILGRKFAMTTIFSSLFVPAALDVLDALMGNVVITDDPLLLAVFTGLCMGGSLGLVVRGGASTGGMDIPPLIVSKLLHIPVSNILWIFDLGIMLLQLMYHPLEDLLYGIVLIMSVSVALNKIMLFGTSRTEIKIISDYSEEIRRAILSQVDRGCTILYGEGGYRGTQLQVILSVVSKHELPKIERVAREIDPSSFVIVSQVSEVWGRGFTYGKKTGTPEGAGK